MNDSCLWTPQKNSYGEAVRYLYGRRTGTIRSLRTPWNKFNYFGIDGFEWNTIVTIAGRSGCGKTMVKDQLVRQVYSCNPEEDFRVLEFSFEMLQRVTRVREFTSAIQKTYSHLCSANGEQISREEYDAIVEYAKGMVDKNEKIDVISEAMTVPEFIKIVDDYMETYAYVDDETGKKTYTKTVMTIDHSYLFKTTDRQDKISMLYDLGEALNAFKMRYPIIFIVLSQLGRNVETPERNVDGKYGNYILPSDLFGGDALYQYSDMVIGLNRPCLKNINFYGPELFRVNGDERLMAIHFLKVRNGEPGLTFFNAVFEEMRIEERQAPERAERRELYNQ